MTASNYGKNNKNTFLMNFNTVDVESTVVNGCQRYFLSMFHNALVKKRYLIPVYTIKIEFLKPLNNVNGINGHQILTFMLNLHNLKPKFLILI